MIDDHKIIYRSCSDLNKTFPSHQAGGVNMSSHNKLMIKNMDHDQSAWLISMLALNCYNFYEFIYEFIHE